nr:cbb3-type cytochrome c oxidase subunit 3 [uncultured Roseateles sp.]
MDINFMRALVTVLSMVAFLAIVAWTYSRRNRHAFDAIAALPLQEDEALLAAEAAATATAPANNGRSA